MAALLFRASCQYYTHERVNSILTGPHGALVSGAAGAGCSVCWTVARVPGTECVGGIDDTGRL